MLRSSFACEINVRCEIVVRNQAGAELTRKYLKLSIFQSGAQGRNRTTDTVIFSHVLYQLSYLGPRAARGRAVGRERAL